MTKEELAKNQALNYLVQSTNSNYEWDDVQWAEHDYMNLDDDDEVDVEAEEFYDDCYGDDDF